MNDKCMCCGFHGEMDVSGAVCADFAACDARMEAQGNTKIKRERALKKAEAKLSAAGKKENRLGEKVEYCTRQISAWTAEREITKKLLDDAKNRTNELWTDFDYATFAATGKSAMD